MKKRSLPVILMLFAALVAAGTVVFFNWKSRPKTNQAASQSNKPAGFSEANLVSVRLDTFARMLHVLYDPNVEIKEEGKDCLITLKQQGRRTSDFYNNNTALKNYKGSGFSIQHNVEEDQIRAQFETEKKDTVRFVRIPTDVFFRIAEKFYHR
jgi:hypothetical protein